MYSSSHWHLVCSLFFHEQVGSTGSTAKAVGLCFWAVGFLHLCVVAVGLSVPLDGSSDTFFKRYTGFVAEQMLRLADIGARVGHIAGLIRQDLDIRHLTRVFLDQIDKLFERRATALAEIENLVGIGPINGSHHAIDDIINVGVIPTAAAVSKLLHLDAATDAVNEFERSHVGSSAGSVDGEESQRGYIEIVQVVVRVGEQLASLFGGGIGRNGLVHDFGFGKEGRLRTTIDRAGAGKDKVLHAKLGRKLHESCCSFHIGMNVHERILNGWTHTGACRHVTDPLRSFLLKQGRHELLVANVATVNRKSTVRMFGTQQSEIVLFDRNIVVVVHFVDNHHIIATRQEVIGNAAADEAGTARDKHLLVSHVGLHNSRVLPCCSGCGTDRVRLTVGRWCRWRNFNVHDGLGNGGVGIHGVFVVVVAVAGRRLVVCQDFGIVTILSEVWSWQTDAMWRGRCYNQ